MSWAAEVLEVLPGPMLCCQVGVFVPAAPHCPDGWPRRRAAQPRRRAAGGRLASSVEGSRRAAARTHAVPAGRRSLRGGRC